MKRTSLFAILILTSFGCFAQDNDNEGFVRVKNDPPFEVHERWVEFPGKQPAVTSRELKSEFTVNAPIHKIIRIIRDESQVNLWQSNIRSFKIYQKADTSMWDEYSCRNVPWPLEDQDSFMEYQLKEIRPNEEYLIIFKSRVDDQVAPVNEDINRIELTGSWRFVVTSPGVVRVTYRIQSVPATSVPRMILDPVVRNNLVATIKSLTEIVEK